MGSAGSTFFHNLGGGLLHGVSDGIMGGLMGGPAGAAGAIASDAIGGLTRGIHQAVALGNHPAGPQTVAAGADALVQGPMQFGMSLAKQGAFGQHTKAMAHGFEQAVQGGGTLRSAMVSAGMQGGMSALSAASKSGLMNKAGGVAGASPLTVISAGSALARQALGKSGASTVYRQSVINGIGSYAHSFASHVLASSMGGPPGFDSTTRAMAGKRPRDDGSAGGAAAGTGSAPADGGLHQATDAPKGSIPIAAGGPSTAVTFGGQSAQQAFTQSYH